MMYRERILLIPKEGSLGQDRFARSPGRGVWVLCDGASEGFDGGGWARVLSLALARFRSIRRAVERARRSRIGPFARPVTAIPSDGGMDWSAVLARNRGSFSTFLRVRVGPRMLEVEGTGDTVVFLLRGYELVYGFPAMEAGFFRKDPLLIPDRPGEDLPPVWAAVFPWRKRRITSLLLATDALAQFLVSLDTTEQREALVLLHRGMESRIRKTLEEERERDRLRWDDLSFLWIDLRRPCRTRRSRKEGG